MVISFQSLSVLLNNFVQFTELGRRSIYHATHRDAYSGGTVRVYHVKKDGWNLISEQDCLDLHRRYQAEKKQ